MIIQRGGGGRVRIQRVLSQSSLKRVCELSQIVKELSLALGHWICYLEVQSIVIYCSHLNKIQFFIVRKEKKKIIIKPVLGKTTIICISIYKTEHPCIVSIAENYISNALLEYFSHKYPNVLHLETGSGQRGGQRYMKVHG